VLDIISGSKRISKPKVNLTFLPQSYSATQSINVA